MLFGLLDFDMNDAVFFLTKEVLSKYNHFHTIKNNNSFSCANT